MEAAIPPAPDSVSRSVRIVVDDREGRSPVCERLALLPEVSLDIRRLATGDYQVEAEWTFERKTIPDFATSLVDGRLFRQAARLGRYPGGRALILEGPDAQTADTGVSREAWQGALIALGLAFHLPVLRTADADDTVRMLLYAARQVSRHRDTAFIPKQRRARTLERQRLRVLAALPGIGAHRARLLLEHFGSIESVILADEVELAEVRGIGPHTAHRIHTLVAASSAAAVPGDAAG